MSNPTKSNEAQQPSSNLPHGDGQPLVSGAQIAGACVLEKPLNWPWPMEVWLARINGDQKQSVASIIPKSLTRQSNVYAELKAATLRVEAVKHPFILPVRSWVEDSGNAAIISSHAEANSLLRLLEESDNGFFEVAEIKGWVAQLGRALDDAHEAGLVHGWLSVQDLVVTAEDDLLIANFGIARMLAGAGVADERMLAVASPAAMGGDPPSIADDVYGIGSVIFHLVTGSSLFQGPGVAQKVLEEVPESMQARRERLGRGGVPIAPFWEEVVAGCLSKDPTKRPKRARDVVRLLGIGMKPHPIALLQAGAGEIAAPQELAAKKGNSSLKASPSLGRLKGSEENLPERHENSTDARKGSGGKWALAALLLAFTGVAYLVSGKRGEKVQNVPTPAVGTASPAQSVAPIQQPRASASPAQTTAVLPDGLPSLESMGQKTPSASPTPESPAAVAATPGTEPALNPSPQPLSAASPEATVAPSVSPTPTQTTPPQFTNSLGMKFAAVGQVKFSIWETRVRDFEAFAKASDLRPGLWKQPGFSQTPDHPVVYVSWDDAMAFCKWLTQKDLDAGLIKTSEIYRLPTDLEWSRAVGLPPEQGDTAESRDMGVADVYPWGMQWPPAAGAGNYTGEETGSDVAIRGYDDGFPYTSPVGSFQPNAFGIYDMGGNAWEWCMDFWNPARKYRVLRGGSWYNGALKLSLLSSCRVNAQQGSSTDNFGFRVVLAPINSLPPSSR